MANSASVVFPSIAVVVDGHLFYMQDKSLLAVPVGLGGGFDMNDAVDVNNTDAGVEHIPGVLATLKTISDRHQAKADRGDYEREYKDDCKDFSVMVQAVVNVRLKHIHADDAATACQLAADSVDFASLFRMGENDPRFAHVGGGDNIAHVESGDEIACFLVDQIGDEAFERSQWMAYNHDGKVVPDLGN